MKHFLVTHRSVILYLFILHWPVFLYLFKYFIGRSASVNRSALSEPNVYRNITSVSQPLERSTMRHRSAKESNREQETKESQNVEKTRRSAPARVGGSSGMLLWVHAFSRVSENAPPLWKSLGKPFRKKVSRAAFLWYFPLQKQRKVHPKPNDQAATISR